MRIEYTCPVSLIPIPLLQWQYFLERKKATGIHRFFLLYGSLKGMRDG